MANLLSRMFRWTTGLVALILAASLLLSNCVSFSMNPSKVEAHFTHQPYQPSYHTYIFEDRSMSYVRIGEPNQPLVLFVHGSPGSWSAFLDFLSDQQLLMRAQLASVDRPGFGDSGRGNPEPSLQRQAAAIAPILTTIAAQQPKILVGHSLGGPVIARLAMDYPDLVQGLILVAPSIDPALEKIHWFQIPADWWIFSWLVPVDWRTSNREILPLRGELEKLLPLWQNIRAPVTVIQGEDDVLVPPGNADFAAQQLTNTTIEMVRLPGVNHFIPWERPELISQAIHQQLDRLDGFIKSR